MAVYAYIADGFVRELLETDGDIAEMFCPEMVWVDVTGIEQAPEEGWSASLNGEEWRFAAPAMTGESIRSLALAALARSDLVILRCYESGIEVPEEWKDFRKDLRSVASGASDAESLPAQPGYPE